MKCKTKTANSLTREADIKSRRKEHFSEVLNRPDPNQPPEILGNQIELDVNTDPPTEL